MIDDKESNVKSACVEVAAIPVGPSCPSCKNTELTSKIILVVVDSKALK